MWLSLSLYRGPRQQSYPHHPPPLCWWTPRGYEINQPGGGMPKSYTTTIEDDGYSCGSPIKSHFMRVIPKLTLLYQAEKQDMPFHHITSMFLVWFHWNHQFPYYHHSTCHCNMWLSIVMGDPIQTDGFQGKIPLKYGGFFGVPPWLSKLPIE